MAKKAPRNFAELAVELEIAEPGPEDPEAVEPEGEGAVPTPTGTEAEAEPDEELWADEDEPEPEPAGGEPAAAAGEPATEPEPEGESAPEPARREKPAAATEPAGTAPAEAPQPWKPSADGRAIEIPGAYRHRGYVIIPEDKIQTHLQPFLADRGEKDRQVAALRKQIKALDPELHPLVAQARRIQEAVLEVENVDDDALLEWAQELKAKIPMLRVEAEAATAKAQLEMMRQEMTPPREDVERNGLRYWIDAAVGSESWKPAGLDPEKVFERMWRVRRALFVPAEQDDPAGQFRKGETVIDPVVFRGTLEDMARETEGLRTASKRAEEVARQNAAVLAGSTPAGVAGPAQASAPRSKKEVRPKSFAQLKKVLAEMPT